jgi:hypothetical protein
MATKKPKIVKIARIDPVLWGNFPSYGFNLQGKFPLSFGDREFILKLDPGLTLALQNSEGSVLETLPKPNSKDDAIKAQTSQKTYRELKKIIPKFVEAHLPHWQKAMIEEQRWTREEFEKQIVQHALLRPMGQAVLWGGCDTENKIRVVFRLCDDNTWSDREDNAIILPPDIIWMGVLHPVYLTEAEQRQWGELMADYHLIAPFPQLVHPVFLPTEEERLQNTVTRFASLEPEGTRWSYVLPYLGWKEVGQSLGYRKSYKEAGIVIIAVVARDARSWGVKTGVHEVFFVHNLGDLKAGEENLYSKNMPSLVPISEVPPLIFSETLANISRVLAKDSRQL